MGNATSRTDSGFGPLLAGEGHFTLLFEDSIFSIAPAAIAILATLVRARNIAKMPLVTHSGLLLFVKALLGMALTAGHIATIFIWAVLPSVRTDLTLPAAGLTVAGSVSIAMFLLMEHLYSYRPSTFLSLFMSITLLLDMAKTYSCSIRVGLGSLCAMYIMSTVVRFLLLITQEVPKRGLLRDKGRSMGLEAAAGFWTRALFAWLNSTLLTGFRRVLKLKDLPPLAPEFRSKATYGDFKREWDRGKFSHQQNIMICARQD